VVRVFSIISGHGFLFRLRTCSQKHRCGCIKGRLHLVKNGCRHRDAMLTSEFWPWYLNGFMAPQIGCTCTFYLRFNTQSEEAAQQPTRSA
jgi:hypothetical protein